MQNNIISSHGGDIYTASKEYGILRSSILDYSANINPLGISQSLRSTLEASIDSLINYPDPECRDLRYEIGKYLNVPMESIITGNGASEVIFLLLEVLKPRRVIIPSPAFCEYEKAAAACGADIEYFELMEKDEYVLDMDRFLPAISMGCDAIILCNPNNPTSGLISKEDLIRLVRHAADRSVNVILDEAFIELTVGGNNNSIVEALRENANLFIIRAFTKVFAVPGLRLGYVLGDSRTIHEMWNKKLPWSVNGFACEFGKFLSISMEYLIETSVWLERELEWFYDKLSSFSSLKPYRPYTNFVLLKILDKDLRVGELKNKMAEKGILIRDASNFKFLDDRFFRIAVKDRESNTRFLKVLNKVLEK